jgi:hypothetical protein
LLGLAHPRSLPIKRRGVWQSTARKLNVADF